jgi:peptide/nickel transport system substrate-binding protein
LAVALAVPYQQMFEAAVFKRGNPMWGAEGKPATTEWPQPFPFKTDLALAKKLLAEAGYPDGFETTISIDMGEATVSEPEAVLLQQSLAQIGIKTTIEKIPGANFRNAMLQKNRPLHLASFGGWLNFPDYFYFWSYHGQNAVFNTMNYKNPELDRLVDTSRFESDPAKYAELQKAFIGISIDDVPRAPLYQLFLDVGMQKNITGYTYWFHRQLDFRQLAKG